MAGEDLPQVPDLGAGPAVASAPPALSTDEIVDAWFAKHICNSPASRVTEILNYLSQTAIPALKTALKG